MSAHQRPRDRVALALGALATVVGLWLGVSAPEQSPVTPVQPATSTVTTTDAGVPPAGGAAP